MIKLLVILEMKKQFYSTLRINLLEMLNYSRVNKIKKRVSVADVLNQIDILYQLVDYKPSVNEVEEALLFHLKRSYISKSTMGDIEVYSITERGRDIIRRLDDGDETVVI